MKKMSCVMTVAAMVLLAASVFAGAGSKTAAAGKCTDDAQTCLNKMSAKKSAGWLGMKYDKAEDGTVSVKEITPGSPAEAAGFQKGDVLLTLNGASYADKEALKKAKADWKPGSKVNFTVKREGAEKQIAVTLAPIPEAAYAQMVGEHMITDHTKAATAAATP